MALCTGNVLAASGTTSGEFLKIPVYSRGSALGGALVASANGVGGLYYNPAGIGRKENAEFALSHSELYHGLRLENVSLALPVGNASGFGFAATYLGYGDIAGYDASGNSTGNISASSTVLTFGFSHALSQRLALGVAVKPIFEHLGEYSASTVTFDIGMQADFDRVSIGAQYANMGGSLTYIADKMPLPTTLRIGLVYRNPVGGSSISLAATRENSGTSRLAGGVEYKYSHSMIFRVGYRHLLQGVRGSADGLSLGFGLNWQPLMLDYSYRPTGELGGTHQITLSFRLAR
ncbi:MAG: PorV/PorQ family protein [candidate division Zixibacteria bacterium]|nr:PorV/PorQ family protein [candidate division Zixibacteria bacterium]